MGKRRRLPFFRPVSGGGRNFFACRLRSGERELQRIPFAQFQRARAFGHHRVGLGEAPGFLEWLHSAWLIRSPFRRRKGSSARAACRVVCASCIVHDGAAPGKSM